MRVAHQQQDAGRGPHLAHTVAGHGEPRGVGGQIRYVVPPFVRVRRDGHPVDIVKLDKSRPAETSATEEGAGGGGWGGGSGGSNCTQRHGAAPERAIPIPPRHRHRDDVAGSPIHKQGADDGVGGVVEVTEQGASRGVERGRAACRRQRQQAAARGRHFNHAGPFAGPVRGGGVGRRGCCVQGGCQVQAGKASRAQGCPCRRRRPPCRTVGQGGGERVGGWRGWWPAWRQDAVGGEGGGWV